MKFNKNIIIFLTLLIGIAALIYFISPFSIVGNTNYIELMNTAKGNYLKFGSYEVRNFVASTSNYINNRRAVGCWWTADIYNNGVLYQHLGRESSIYSYDTRASSSSIKLSDYTLAIGSTQTQNNGACGVYAYVYYSIDSSKISINVLPLTNTIYTQTTTYLTVQVNNSIPEINRATLTLNYDIPTSVGTFSKTISQNVSVALGLNNYQVLIPTEQITNIIKITPSMDLYFNDALFSGLTFSVVSDSQGVNYDVYSQAVNILAGHYDGETQTITIRDLTQEQLNLANQNIANLSQELVNKQTILAQMQSQLALDNITANNLYNEIQARQQTIDSLAAQVNISEQQINDLNNILLDRQTIITSLSQKVSISEDKITQLNVVLQERQQTISDLSTQLQFSNDKITQLNSIIEERQQIINQLGQNLDLSQQEIAQLYDLINSGNVNAQQLAIQLGIKTTEAQDILNQVAAKDVEIQNLASNLQISQDKLNAITTQLESVNKDMFILSNQLQVSQDKLATITSELDITNKQLIDLGNTLKLSQSDLQSTVSQLTETNKALVDLSIKYKVSQDKINELTRELANTNKPIQNNDWITFVIIFIVIVLFIVFIILRKKK
jgi:hypothetical protein